MSVNGDGSAGDGFEAVDGSAEGGFAGPGGAEEDDDLTFSHGKIDVLQNVVGAVVLVDVGDFDEVFLRFGSCLCGHFEPFHVRCVYDAGCLYAEFSAYASGGFLSAKYSLYWVSNVNF